MAKMSQGRALRVQFLNFVSFVSLCETCLTDVVFHFGWPQGEVYHTIIAL